MPEQSKSRRAYEVIKSRITEGRYVPGYRLVLGQLARELAVSAVPVREAIRLLEAEGFVTFERNVGAQVAGINPTEYRHAMQTLAVVEGAATALAVGHLPPQALQRAADLNERLRRCLDDFDPARFTRLNHEFHETLYEHCPNPHLVEVVRREWTRLAAIRVSTFSFVPGRAATSVAEHEELLGMLSATATAEEVERFLRKHRSTTMYSFLSHEDSARTEGDTIEIPQ